jgi:hypothetical protein
MSNVWFNNPRVLLKNLDDFFPHKTLSIERKINAIARFAIYFGLLIIFLEEDNRWLVLSLILLFISYFIGTAEDFTQVTMKEEQPTKKYVKKCHEPTKDNPFMNYTISDLIDNPNRMVACNYEESKDKIRQEFRSHLYSDPSDIWGKFISDRNFYITPNTGIVNDQTGFAKWCFGDSGKCKTYGQDCLKVRDPVFHRGRMQIISDD